jgi:hypothetical protein
MNSNGSRIHYLNKMNRRPVRIFDISINIISFPQETTRCRYNTYGGWLAKKYENF